MHADPNMFNPTLDGISREVFRHQCIGKFRGLYHLETVLNARKRDLEERIQQLKQETL